ncbi:cobaltochelatase subunit CobN [Bordetella genomosp. 4]|uniref:Cobaltochelatase subunit CobN n=1 Tax=Bordetella genomosp. 4 TaxID=463044 RepID=A0A261UWA0_9BORD|nr:cobaltochelatase subunit CobN [Bordetella genomosp. 4]OZI66154.1 cobaltochelatase subunit CobN [Bordetella genomosp. 4]
MACLYQHALWRWLVLVVFAAMWPTLSVAQDRAVIQVLHTGFVSAEKFQRLQPLATQQSVTLQHLNVEQATPDVLARAIEQAALLIWDVPRPTDRDAVQRHVQALSPSAIRPRLIIGAGKPVWEQLPPQYGKAMVALYTAGGAENFGHFFALAKALSEGAELPFPLLDPPARLPAAGFYHPDAPHVFDNIDGYLHWYTSVRQPVMSTPVGDPSSAGRIAFLIHQGVVADLLTREVDQLIRRSEAEGLLPIVFWFDGQSSAGLAGALKKGNIDALVNLTHLQNGAARSRDFLALDVPVLQTLRFREGEASAWPDAASGIGSRTTAVFLAGPEGWGVSDPLVLSASTAGVSDLLPAQVDALMGKLRSLVALRHTPEPQKKLALMFWNYPAGEKNLGASHLNIPRSIMSIQAALAAQGYAVGKPVGETEIIETAQRMLGALYGTVPLESLLDDDLAALYPLEDYEQWLSALPVARQDELRRAGVPAQHQAVREIKGKRYFVIPRWQLGNFVVMPQMPRAFGAGDHYHDMSSAPDHLYMAAYLYLQQQYAAHALIHLGTHGTQEWLPGKDRGLAATDYPWLSVGNLPVFYPYIQDNVSEAIQAKRRGRAVIVSHQTPPFAPAGLYDQLRDLHQWIHEYQQLDDGAVREQVSHQIRSAAVQAHLNDDLGWTAQQAEQDFSGFLQQLHDHLHELARRAMPLGLHTFGQAAQVEHRISTVMQQLGRPLYDALDIDQDERFAGEQGLQDSPAYHAVAQMLSPAGNEMPSSLAVFEQRARELDAHLQDTQENDMLLAGLAGRFVIPGAGGDPIRNPDVRSGRNLYAFEADKVPTQAAYEAAATAYEQLVQAFQHEHAGARPQKLAFSLWASEATRHLGVTEAQVLHALGLRPVWDSGGRVVSLDIIPTAELGRPRVDVVVQVTGVYRDQFDSFMRLLDEALTRLAALNEPGNPIALNNQRTAAALNEAGLSADAAAVAARYRIFSNAPGEYGTGVPHLALDSTQWDDDAALGKQFLLSSQYAYGAEGWGESPAQANVFAAQLRGTQAVIMSRSSTLHGVLSTDHPFEFLGGLSAAVRHLDGQAPQLMISDLRDGEIRTTGLARFLSAELRERYLNPRWIEAMQKEGYSGTLQVLNVTNNLFGWQAADASTVRDDQWQALFDTYVSDTRALGTRQWFEQHNPTAQAQVLERMAEAIRKGYWDASEQTRRALAERWQELAQRFDVDTGAEVTRQYIADMAQGFGLEASATSNAVPAAKPNQPDSPAAESPQSVQGQVLEPVEPAAVSEDISSRWVLLLMLILLGSGALRQGLRSRHVRRAMQ